MRVVRGGVWHRGVFSGVIWTQVSYPEVAAGRNERHMKASRGPTNDVPAAGHFDATVGGSVSTSPRVTRARCFFVFGVRVFVSVSVSVSVSVVGSLCFSRSSSIGRRIGCEFCWLPACSRWFRFESCIEYCHSANTHNERKIASYLWGRLGLSFYRTVWRGWAKSVLLKNTASTFLIDILVFRERHVFVILSNSIQICVYSYFWCGGRYEVKKSLFFFNLPPLSRNWKAIQ